MLNREWANLEHLFTRLYGKKPAYLELEQFAKSYHASKAYVTWEDQERMKGLGSGSWRQQEERRRAAESFPAPEEEPVEDPADFLIE